MSTLQRKWLAFIQKESNNLSELKNPYSYKPRDLAIGTLSAAFAIMTSMPLKKDIKNDIELLEKKIAIIQTNLQIKPRQKCNWGQTAD